MESVKELISALQSGEKLKYLLFWGHQPQRDGSIGSGCLSQWWKSDFVYEENRFTSAEQWMMYQKAILFGDKQIAEEILSDENPAKVKSLGRKVNGFSPELWDKKKFEIVVKGSFLKFSQNPDLKAYLIGTKNRVLVESSPVDRIWGTGLAKDHEFAEVPQKWKGENLLGLALMKARGNITKTLK